MLVGDLVHLSRVCSSSPGMLEFVQECMKVNFPGGL